MSQVILKPGREKPVRQHHPWIFSGAVKLVDSYGGPGDLCNVREKNGY